MALGVEVSESGLSRLRGDFYTRSYEHASEAQERALHIVLPKRSSGEGAYWQNDSLTREKLTTLDPGRGTLRVEGLSIRLSR